MKKIDKQKLKETSKIIQKLRNNCPLTHCITNYVTINDCANAVLAIGASPAMANEEPEMTEFVNIAGSTIINIGTLLDNQIEAMRKAAQECKKTGTPLTLDPVAVGVSKLRNDFTKEIIDNTNITVIRGNMSEIKAIGKLYNILQETTTAKGVDVAETDIITEDNIKTNAEIIKQIAKKLNTTIAVSGKIDIITDGTNTYLIDNGEQIMSKITGSGCMLTCIIGAFTAVTTPLEAALIGTLSMTIAGELAYKTVQHNKQGSGSFRTYLIDELYNMNEEKITKYGKLYKN
ncbi:hydroxyethylthiazole kinase [Methanosphaera sp. ISO3-F5]|uniref:hydroxyethylthiazole kinase n=1 Tax=Methanosphaera sp. ISO3-F5 TaxID=1452353 RepID=UPI002B262D94|nr:hydroxyethylthiazole kinase [Methanosphaera sp. ISO3-F5]WQH63537.1 hydroxyethylthiazole kinase [Methanosphaera sp. ISO3-F5]